MYHSLLETDVFVTGGGPAGLAAAIAARQAGLRVKLVDCAIPPIDKACGEGIMPDGLDALAKLGVNLSPENAALFKGIQFIEGDTSIAAKFPKGCGLGIRRTTLHQILAEHAASVGVSIHWGAHVTGVTEEGVSVNGRNLRCRWIIGADGQNSRVRRWGGLDDGSKERRRFGFRRHFAVEPWSEYVNVHWSNHGQLYVTPISPEEVCVAFITRQPGLRFNHVYQLFPEVAHHLTNARTREQGAITSTRKLRAASNDRYALIGEASGSVDAITGQGLSVAFQQASALGKALSKGDLRIYECAHRRIGRLPRFMAGMMLAMDDHPRFRSRVLRAFSAEPQLFSRMLALHTGAISISEFGVTPTLALGWNLITA